MKRHTLFLILLLCSWLLNAQEPSQEKSAFYFNTDLHLGNYLGVGIGANVFFDTNKAIQFGYIGGSKKAKAQPRDFHGGFAGLISFGITNPRDSMRTVYISYATGGYMGPQRKSHALFSIGLGYSTIKNSVNFTKRASGSILAGNYSWDIEKLASPSLVLGCRFEFPLSGGYGLFAASPVVIINPENTYVCLSFGQIIGSVTPR